MLKQKSFFRFITYLLSITIIFTGCHSFYEIPTEDFRNIDTMDDIKIVYKNGKEFVVEKDDTTNIIFRDSILIVQSGIDKKTISMNEVNKLKECRSDLGGTITLSIIALVLIILSLPRFSM